MIPYSGTSCVSVMSPTAVVIFKDHAFYHDFELDVFLGGSSVFDPLLSRVCLSILCFIVITLWHKCEIDKNNLEMTFLLSCCSRFLCVSWSLIPCKFTGDSFTLFSSSMPLVCIFFLLLHLTKEHHNVPGCVCSSIKTCYCLFEFEPSVLYRDSLHLYGCLVRGVVFLGARGRSLLLLVSCLLLRILWDKNSMSGKRRIDDKIFSLMSPKMRGIEVTRIPERYSIEDALDAEDYS